MWFSLNLIQSSVSDYLAYLFQLSYSRLLITLVVSCYMLGCLDPIIPPQSPTFRVVDLYLPSSTDPLTDFNYDERDFSSNLYLDQNLTSFPQRDQLMDEDLDFSSTQVPDQNLDLFVEQEIDQSQSPPFDQLLDLDLVEVDQEIMVVDMEFPLTSNRLCHWQASISHRSLPVQNYPLKLTLSGCLPSISSALDYLRIYDENAQELTFWVAPSIEQGQLNHTLDLDSDPTLYILLPELRRESTLDLIISTQHEPHSSSSRGEPGSVERFQALFPWVAIQANQTLFDRWTPVPQNCELTGEVCEVNQEDPNAFNFNLVSSCRGNNLTNDNSLAFNGSIMNIQTDVNIPSGQFKFEYLMRSTSRGYDYCSGSTSTEYRWTLENNREVMTELNTNLICEDRIIEWIGKETQNFTKNIVSAIPLNIQVKGGDCAQFNLELAWIRAVPVLMDSPFIQLTLLP